jgi:Secretion system C-terminal sorting domain
MIISQEEKHMKNIFRYFFIVFCLLTNTISSLAQWIQTNGPYGSYNISSFAVSGTNLFAGTWNSGVYLSTNNGTSWTAVNTGLTDSYSNIVNVYALVVSGTNLFAETDGGVFRRPLSEMTSVEKLLIDLPKNFNLDQNFPNPFNPSTTISFSIPSKSFVSLKMFDIMGREVATIVAEEMSAGSYSRQWNAANMSSGIYFYRLQAGSFTGTKKLILLK